MHCVRPASSMAGMSDTVTPQQAAETARQLLDERVAVIEELAQASTQLSRARDALTDAEKNYARQWAAAERAGWSTTELRKVGLTEPGRKRPGRPRKASASPKTETPAQPSSTT